jgi:hypothetical protein
MNVTPQKKSKSKIQLFQISRKIPQLIITLVKEKELDLLLLE